MVDYCLTIEDRAMRTNCAASIVKYMSNLFPEADTKVLWDHLNVMSGFKLDVDFPVEVVAAEELNPVPERIEYSDRRIRWRHYGKNIEKMVDKVASLDDGPDKDKLISMIAHHMKKLQFIHNKEGVDDAKILRDLAIYSQGRISLNPEEYLLHEFQEAPVAAAPAKKKKKKK